MAAPIKSPEVLQREHVLAAAKQWARDGHYLTFRDSTRYDVIVERRRYPPKAICSIALKEANGAIMQSVEFKGAKDGPWQHRLKQLRFKVVLKNGTSTRPNERRKQAKQDVAKELAALRAKLARNAAKGTDKEAIVKVRLFAGKLRKAVLRMFDGRCCVTSIEDQRLLVCSHIVPWSKSSNAQRVDPENTLLLAANWDALFDRHLISFADDGALVISAALKKSIALRRMGLRTNAKLARKWLTLERRAYLKTHREETLRLRH